MTNPDFRDLLAALSAADVRFLIVGSYAVTFHSEPRFTKDLDVWVDRSAPQRVFDALKTFGAPLDGVQASDFGQPDIVYQVGLPPNRIDVLTDITGVDFERAWAGRVPAAYGDVSVHYLSKQDLIAKKRASGRPRDLLDCEALEREGGS